MRQFPWALLLIPILVALPFCKGEFLQPNSLDLELIKLTSGAIIQPKNNLPSDGGSLFDTDSELNMWLNTYGIKDFPTNKVDFTKETVAILVQPWVPCQLKSAIIDNKKAQIVFLEDYNSPISAPCLLVGEDIKRFIALCLPKCQSITIVTKEEQL
ncbi:MAG: hypothetical protein A4E55_00331 [Pelotomaculum sp. PtaU1.Bin035]|nr:MAG: hypothetical protein A4E55_00331 [Pelotomaculum sp. PtaU1.Bin035]